MPCHDLNQKNNNKSLGGDFLGVESQGIEVLGVENRPQLNKDIQSKDIQNKEIYLNNVVQEVIEYLNQKEMLIIRLKQKKQSKQFLNSLQPVVLSSR